MLVPPVNVARVVPFYDRDWINEAVPPDTTRFLFEPALAGDRTLVTRCLDATVLGATDGEARVRAVARDAARAGAAALCVYPVFAHAAADELTGSPVALDLVAGGFPDGLSTLDARVLEVRLAREVGASEIDVPIRRDLANEARWEELFAELAAIREAASGCALKVIVSTPDLSDAASIVGAARVAIMAGADFLKTATGRESGPPTHESGAAICAVIAEEQTRTGRRVGFKAAGGIRDVAGAIGWAQLVAASLGADWLVPNLFRIGSSRLLYDPAVWTSDDGTGRL